MAIWGNDYESPMIVFDEMGTSDDVGPGTPSGLILVLVTWTKVANVQGAANANVAANANGLWNVNVGPNPDQKPPLDDECGQCH